MFKMFFRKMFPLWDNEKKYGRVRQAIGGNITWWQYNMVHAICMPDNKGKNTGTHIDNMWHFFSRQKWLCEGAFMLHYPSYSQSIIISHLTAILECINILSFTKDFTNYSLRNTTLFASAFTTYTWLSSQANWFQQRNDLSWSDAVKFHSNWRGDAAWTTRYGVSQWDTRC